MGERVPIETAAARLGLSAEAIRKRLRRGTLSGEKVDGKWWIILPEPAAGRRQDAAGSRPDEWHDGQQDVRQDGGYVAYEELVEALRAENARLWTELETRAEELRRKDHIIAGLVQRIPELSAASDAQEAPQVDENPPHDAQDFGYVYRPPEASRRPWWKLWR